MDRRTIFVQDLEDEDKMFERDTEGEENLMGRVSYMGVFRAVG